ncbi:MAG TPA: hypothetical protein VNI84_16205 [Pyrinomonadaceae bacterium]|nr:hypothetical protein [Pyrinomonadaceae bacterium]
MFNRFQKLPSLLLCFALLAVAFPPQFYAQHRKVKALVNKELELDLLIKGGMVIDGFDARAGQNRHRHSRRTDCLRRQIRRKKHRRRPNA